MGDCPGTESWQSFNLRLDIAAQTSKRAHGESLAACSLHAAIEGTADFEISAIVSDTFSGLSFNAKSALRDDTDYSSLAVNNWNAPDLMLLHRPFAFVEVFSLATSDGIQANEFLYRGWFLDRAATLVDDLKKLVSEPAIGASALLY